MKLTRAEIAGYRSISKKIVIHFDSKVTVILGANDHGKTNLLDALSHLNKDSQFDPERDLNWDHVDQSDEFPHLTFEFELSDADREKLLEVAVQKLAEATAQAATNPTPPASPQSPSATVPSSALTAPNPGPPSDPSPLPISPQLNLDHVPKTAQCYKKGLTKGLVYVKAPNLPDGAMTKFMSAHMPRVELIRAQETIPDSVAATELTSETHEFMRGIFYYAGIEKDEFESLFSQTDTTMMRLETAVTELNETLRTHWTQGSDLEYRLVHDSKTDRVVLRIKDPAVADRVVRASQRSSGFTHFFTLKTVLHARQKEHPANAYIFLFDELGIYLHPAGQYDLLQVLDTIGSANQIVYSTHSLFMLNKTFPARHRLIVKTSEGTQIDGKPYVGRWGAALEALGLSLAGTILFAQHIVLAEGDSDPIYIPAILQKLVALDRANVDLNAFCVIATETSRNADALIRILLEAATPPKLGVLVDGDEGGKARLKGIHGLLKSHAIASKQLLEGTTIEDYLPLVGELYVRAVADYVAKVKESQGSPVESHDEFRASFRKSFREAFEEGKVTKGVAEWASSAGQKLGNLEQPPSKIGIAREYVALLDQTPEDKFTAQSLQRPIKLLELIREIMPIPELREARKEILKTD